MAAADAPDTPVLLRTDRAPERREPVHRVVRRRPLGFELGDDLQPLEAKALTDRYLDPEAAAAAAAAVAKQAG